MIFCDYVSLLTESYDNDKYEDRIVYWFNQYRDARRMALIKNRFVSAKVIGHVFDLRRPFVLPEDRWTYIQYVAHVKASECLFAKESDAFNDQHKVILAEHKMSKKDVQRHIQYSFRKWSI